jgi:spermidine/putrescine transport system permease protein
MVLGRRVASRAYDPTKAPRLRAVTVAYLCWSLIPLLIAVMFSFNDAPSISRWEGFSLRWWIGNPRAQESLVYDPDLRGALLHSLTLAFWTTLIVVPMGTAFALGARGWRSRTARVGLMAMLTMLVLPPIALAEPIYLVFVGPLRRVPFGDLGWFGTRGQLAGLVTLLLPLATIVVFARLLMLDRQHEDVAADLGAPPNDVVMRIIVPQIATAIGAATAVAFAGAMGEFVMVDVLQGGNDTRALAPALFGAVGGPEPRNSVIGTVLAIAGAIACSSIVLTFRSVAGWGSAPRRAGRRTGSPPT